MNKSIPPKVSVSQRPSHEPVVSDQWTKMRQVAKSLRGTFSLKRLLKCQGEALATAGPAIAAGHLRVMHSNCLYVSQVEV